MRVTMVKKRLANGDPCPKCAQTEDMLRRRGHWDRIDEVIWAIEGEPDAPGWVIAKLHDVDIAPFFVVEVDGEEILVKSPMVLMKRFFAGAAAERTTSVSAVEIDVAAIARELEGADPQRILAFALETFEDDCAIAFSGGHDVVLIDMAARLGRPFRTFTLDTGRLHCETYDFMDEVRARYGIEIEVFLPDSGDVMDLMRRRGANSFLRDGHGECCAVRQVRPLARALSGRRAWVTGLRRDTAFDGGAAVPVVQVEAVAGGAPTPRIRFNPLGGWSAERVGAYIRENEVPTNPLNAAGYGAIGCAPCTRPAAGDDPPRSMRWWWEGDGLDSELDDVASGEGI
jgi:phosphoadenosine phosphosulfate reductase